MVQLRLIGSLMLAAAGMEDEYFHTQLLQTKLAVEDKKLNLKAEVFMKKYFAGVHRPDGACKDDPECAGPCELHYGEKGSDCEDCLDKITDPDDEAHVSDDVIQGKFMNEGYDAAMEFMIDTVDNCVGSQDKVREQCPEQGLFACVMCAHNGMCMPDDCTGLDACIEGMSAMLPQPPPPQPNGDLIQKQSADGDDGESTWVCSTMWPDADLDECKEAAADAKQALRKPEVVRRCTSQPPEDRKPRDPTECFVDAFMTAMTQNLGDCIVAAACKDELKTDDDPEGEKVDVEICYEEGEKCDSCDWDISDDCKTCVKAACEGREDKCQKPAEDDALILAQHKLAMKQRRSVKTIFAVAYAKATLAKMIFK